MRSVAALLIVLMLTAAVPREAGSRSEPRILAAAAQARADRLEERHAARSRLAQRRTARRQGAATVSTEPAVLGDPLTAPEPDLATYSTIALLRFAADKDSATSDDREAVYDEVRKRGARALHQLVPLLAVERNRLRSLAHDGLVALGEPALHALLTTLEHPDAVTRNYALSILESLVDSGDLSRTARSRVVRAALWCLQDPNADNRDVAATILGTMPEALPILESELAEGTQCQRQTALYALSWADDDDETVPARAVLGGAARDAGQSEGVRRAAAYWLAEGADAKEPIRTFPASKGLPAVRLWALAAAACDTTRGAPARIALRARAAEARSVFSAAARTVRHEEIAESAVEYLTLLGSEPHETWLDLARSAASPTARWHALDVLTELADAGGIGRAAPAFRAVCIELLHDRDECVRLSAAMGLVTLHEAGFDTTSDLVKALRGPPAVAAVMANALGYLESCEDADILAELERVEPVADEEPSALALARDEDDAEPAVPALIALLRDPDDAVVDEAARTLGNLDEPGHAAAPFLEAALIDEYGCVRVGVAYALGNMEEAAKSALPALVTAFRRTLRTTVRDQLIHVLQELEWDPEPEDVPILAEMSSRRTPRCGRWRCRAAVRALGQLGRAAAAATPSLLAAARTQEHEELARTIEALGRISHGEPEVLRVLVAALEGDDLFYGCTTHYNVPAAAAEALWTIRVSTPETRAALIKALEHENPVVREAATATAKHWNCLPRTVQSDE